jgi:hypothetical protein
MIGQDPRLSVGTLAATVETERGTHPKEGPGEGNPIENKNQRGCNQRPRPKKPILYSVRPHGKISPTGVVVGEALGRPVIDVVTSRMWLHNQLKIHDSN